MKPRTTTLIAVTLMRVSTHQEYDGLARQKLGWGE